MKILFINYSDVGSGTPIAARRLLDAMLVAKIDVAFINKSDFDVVHLH
jgi:hypothetical protein